MPTIYDIANAHRARVLANERLAASDMVRAYGDAWRAIRASLDELLKRMAEAKAHGIEVKPAWLMQQGRLEALLSQSRASMNAFAQYAEKSIVDAQRGAIAAAQEDAQQLIMSALDQADTGVRVSATFSRMPDEAVTRMVGHLGDGSPLRDLLSQLGPDAEDAIRRALITGVATGQGGRVIARNIREQLGGNLNRALVIARTETLRAYRESTRDRYLANADVLGGWMWHAGLGMRCCAMCVAKHGTRHSLEERLTDHPCGRCSMVPIVPGYEMDIQSGEDWFNEQQESVQVRIMGKSAHDAWKAGDVKLKDFVGVRTDPRWGDMHYTRSLKEMIGEQKAKAYTSATMSSAQTKVQEQKAEAMTAIRAKEKEIRVLKHEVAYAVDAKGNVLLDKGGDKNSVTFTSAETVKLQNSHGVIMTHNHPAGWDYPHGDPRHNGNSFSPQDIKYACTTRASEMRVITPTKTYSMRPPDGGWNSGYWDNTLRATFHKVEQSVHNEFKVKIAAGNMTTEDAEAQHFHEVWTRVAKLTGLRYTQIED